MRSNRSRQHFRRVVLTQKRRRAKFQRCWRGQLRDERRSCQGLSSLLKKRLGEGERRKERGRGQSPKPKKLRSWVVRGGKQQKKWCARPQVAPSKGGSLHCLETLNPKPRTLKPEQTQATNIQCSGLEKKLLMTPRVQSCRGLRQCFFRAK